MYIQYGNWEEKEDDRLEKSGGGCLVLRGKAKSKDSFDSASFSGAIMTKSNPETQQRHAHKRHVRSSSSHVFWRGLLSTSMPAALVGFIFAGPTYISTSSTSCTESKESKQPVPHVER